MTDEGRDTGGDTATEARPERQRRLVRRMDGKIIAGVANGLGAYTGVDPVVWRIGFVVLAFFSGIGVIAYIAGWLVMPRDDGTAPPPPPVDPTRAKTWIGIAALVAGGALLAHQLLPLQGGLVWGLLLIGVGVALWSRPDAPSRDIDEPAPGPPFATEPGPVASAAPAVTPPEPPASAAGARGRRSSLGRMTLGAVALAVGALLLLDNLGWFRPRAADGIAVVLVVIGAALVLGAWWGRARWLIVPGLVLSVTLAGAMALPGVSFRDGFGDALYRPTTRAELRDEYRLSAGELLLDLTEVNLSGRTTRIRSRVGFGELAVIVPSDVRVRASARVQGGEIDLLGRQVSGWERSQEVVTDGPATAGLLALDLEVVFGQIRVIDDSTTVVGGRSRIFNSRRR